MASCVAVGTCGFGSDALCVRIRHDNIRALRSPTKNGGCRLELAEFVIARRAEHDHAVGKGELCMRKPALIILNDQVLLKTKGITKPLHHLRSVAVAHRGNDHTGHIFCNLKSLQNWACWNLFLRKSSYKTRKLLMTLRPNVGIGGIVMVFLAPAFAVGTLFT